MKDLKKLNHVQLEEYYETCEDHVNFYAQQLHSSLQIMKSRFFPAHYGLKSYLAYIEEQEALYNFYKQECESIINELQSG